MEVWPSGNARLRCIDGVASCYGCELPVVHGLLASRLSLGTLCALFSIASDRRWPVAMFMDLNESGFARRSQSGPCLKYRACLGNGGV